MDLNIETKLNTLSELSRLKLADLLRNIPGQKNLIIEQTLIRSLDKICGTKWLKLHDVDKIYKLEDNLTMQPDPTQVFIISSNLVQFKRIINILETNNCIECEAEPPDVVKYHIIVIPKLLNVFNMLLEESGMWGHVHLHSFIWQFIYLDDGIISLELNNIFYEIYVDHDLSLLSSLSKSLYFLFDIVGKPNIMISIGKYAQNIYDHIDLYEKNLGSSDKKDSDFGVMLIMDRTVDLLSTILTNVTYTGLVGEVYTISGGVVENTEGELGTAQQKPLFNLDNKNDTIYSEIKYRHISEVSDLLGQHARQFKLENQISKDLALAEIKTYVQTKLQTMSGKSRYLSFHLNTCEKIFNELGVKFETLQSTERSCVDNVNKTQNLTTIEDYIITENKFRSLRLFCLLSLTQKLSWDEYNNLKKQYLHEHGYNLLYIFQNLLNCGLMLQPQKLSLSLPNITQKKDFYSVANKLKLIPNKPEEINMRLPICPSFVFGGNYIPIIAQLITSLMQSQTLGEVTSKLNLLNGTLKTQGLDKPFPLQQRSVLIFIIGGVTYAEIAASKLVEKLTGCKITLASNCLISSNDLVSQCM